MVIVPKTRGFICTTAHPAGCAKNVLEQIDFVKGMPHFSGTKKALIIGSSTGYGLATRIAAAFGSGAATLGVAFERPASGSRTATAGWYNTAAFSKYAHGQGLYAKNIMGDAFSPEIKTAAAELIKKDLGKVDLVVYSLAAPRRTYAGQTWSSSLKPVGRDFTSKTIDLRTMEVTDVTVPAASQDEIDGTVKVMGGEDWQLWIDALAGAGVLEKGFNTVAYSYIGPSLTHAIYHDGTVGLAKADVERAAREMNSGAAAKLGGRAFVSVNKAVVTQASSAIPVVPLYISILFKIMKAEGTHEGCIGQMYRMLAKKLYLPSPETDAQGRIRVDDLELDPKVQQKVMDVWGKIDNTNLRELADIDGYGSEFLRLFGFGLDGVDYSADVPPDAAIEGLI